MCLASLLLHMLFSTTGMCQVYPTYLAADINQGNYQSLAQQMDLPVEANGLFFYIDPTTQRVWRSDGTLDGTFAVFQAQSTLDHAGLGSLTSLGDKVVFAGETVEYGFEVWVSDGTIEGTKRISDIVPGPGSANMWFIFGGNGVAYFAPTTPTYGMELWRTDGTEAGTYLVKDIIHGSGSSAPSEFCFIGNTIYFSANDGVNGYELWKSDGTLAGTVMVKDVRTGSRLSSSPKRLANVNGTLFFTAYDPTQGRELWKSDGTAAGTVFVKDIRPGTEESLPDNLTGVGSTLFFGANNGTNGRELWKSDGTAAGTVMVKDIQPGSASYAGGGYPHLSNFTSFNGKLYFVTYTDRPRVWVSDGTSAGTIPVSPLDKHITGIDLNLTVFNGALYYVTNATSGTPRYMQLWKTDGTMAGHTLVRGDLGLAPNKNMELTPGSNRVYFTSIFDYTSPENHLWYTDGTTAGTLRVEGAADYYTHSYPAHLTTLDDRIIFEAFNGKEKGLYYSQGNQATTVKLRAFPGADLSDFYESGPLVFFIENPDGAGNTKNLWCTDGSAAGTIKLAGLTNIDDPYSFQYETVGFTVFITYQNMMWRTLGSPSSTIFLAQYPNRILWMTGTSSQLLFAANDGARGYELWKSDGTPSGTVFMRDIWSGGNSSLYSHGNYQEGIDLRDPAVSLNGIAYFLANAGGDSNWELWRSDGTLSGTQMLKNDETGVPFSPRNSLKVVNNQIYLFTWEENSDEGLPDLWELWKSDGTTQGTVKVTRVLQEEWWQDPTALMFGGPDKLYFLPTGFQEPHNLWVSDGTAAGTKIVEQLGSKEGVIPVYHTFIGNRLFLSGANDYDKMLVSSDGTDCRTFYINFGGDPEERYEHVYLAALGNTLFMPGIEDPYGKELRAYDNVNDPCGATLAAARIEDNSVGTTGSTTFIRSYPNPFVQEFSLELRGGQGAEYEVEVRSFEGQIIMKPTRFNVNEVHRMGQEWNKGIYLLKIRDGQRVTTERLIKN
jgi:ELWxxDGT repeat protein